MGPTPAEVANTSEWKCKTVIASLTPIKETV